MKQTEFYHILAAVIILTFVAGFQFIIVSNWESFAKTFLFSSIIIALAIMSKKLMAYSLDANVEHSIWGFSRWGWQKHQYFKKEVPVGIILPAFLSVMSLGFVKFMALLTFETRALKVRAARRFGFYSFTEMTDWHDAVIGAAGIVTVLLLSLVTYFLPFSGLEYLTKMAVFYAFSNMLPLSHLDGASIFFGSRILWTTLASITIIFTAYAILLV